MFDLVLQEKGIVIDSGKKLTDIRRYIRYIIDIYSVTEINRDSWLTDTEKDFYVATVIHYINGYVNPICEESVQIYKDYFRPNIGKPKIADYVNRIRNKGWLSYDLTDKAIEIPEIFHFIKPDQDSIDFNLRFSYEHNRDKVDRSDNLGTS